MENIVQAGHSRKCLRVAGITPAQDVKMAPQAGIEPAYRSQTDYKILTVSSLAIRVPRYKFFVWNSNQTFWVCQLFTVIRCCCQQVATRFLRLMSYHLGIRASNLDSGIFRSEINSLIAARLCTCTSAPSGQCPNH